MAEVIAGLLTSAVVKIASDKISSAIAEQANLVWNFSDDLEDMKDTMVSIGAVLEDAEKQSVREKSVQVWLKRLKNAALDISDMMDDYHDADTQEAAKMPGMFSFLPAAHKKMVLANKMKNMKEKLRKINEQRQSFNLTPSTGSGLEQKHNDQRETTSVFNEAKIFGRDGEKRKITDLLSASHHKDGIMVLPIYGLGGMGKSTLAQLVYSDTQFKQYDHRVWVYVSEVFDLKKIGTSIISQLPTVAGQQNPDNLQTIHQYLDTLFSGKKILIVLDDIWEEDEFKLEHLKNMFHNKGVMIDVIVTTRSEDIARKIFTNEPYKLEPLKDDICWDIIKRYSEFEVKSYKGELEKIGLDIAKKCGGLALAAQALGYVLKSKGLDGWSDMKNSDIWYESSGDMKVLPSLKLSYERMLPILRLCFSYCAIFPKGHEINENDLIHQWVCLDFINKPSEGKEYIEQLLGMSFLQHSKLPLSVSKKLVVRYNMHDLVHDLARSIIGDELIVVDAAMKKNTSEHKYCRYVLLTNYDGQTKLSNILPKKVRALHYSSSNKLDLHDNSFSFAKRLRILDFSGCSNVLLPTSIGQLKQLKCLIAPKLQNESLPVSISELSKLQYLNLHGSSLISALPDTIGKLGSLIHLNMSGCTDISALPESFGNLKEMVLLDMSGCSMVRELPGSLGNLEKLQHLDLSECSNVEAIPESLCGLTQLQYLNLSSCFCLERIPEAVGSLVGLKYLGMSYCFEIRELPESFAYLRNLLHLNLKRCRNINKKGLPRALGGLTSLQYLNMSNIFQRNELSYLNDAIGNLTNLEHLDLSDCLIFYLCESIGNLKKLHTLDLSGCRKLRCLPASITAIITLKTLLIDGCKGALMDQANSRLHYSLTLPLFKVRSADDVSAGSNLPLLEGLNVPELRLHSLENVRSLEEACKVKLLGKSNLSTLTLTWNLRSDRFLDDKDLLGQLEPPRGLKHMSLQGYNSPSFPSWFMGISHHLPNLVLINLDNLPICSNLPPLGQLRNLEKLSLQECPRVTKINKEFCGGEGAFCRLSEFSLYCMEGLEEWETTYSVVGGMEVFMFPVLDHLFVSQCPRLSLKPCPPTFRVCTIWNSDHVISSLEAAGCSHLTYPNPSTALTIVGSDSQSLRLFHHFPNLQELEISMCSKMTSLPESTRHLASLQSLDLNDCGISALPEWLGDLSSLKSLTISDCKSIKSLPQSIQRLTKLQRLSITENKELKQWCESEENKKLLAHIKDFRLKMDYFDFDFED